jgi:Domain of unknown function (DUF4173)
MTDDAAVPIGMLSPDRRWRWDGTAWTPAPEALPRLLPLPAWARVRISYQATWWAACAALLVGLVADQWLRVGAFGIGASLAIACTALALVFAARMQRVESRLLAGAAVLFAVWLSMRASPWLLWPDLAAGLILLGTAASTASRGTLLDMGIAESAARGFHATLHWLAGGVWAFKPVRRIRTRFAAAAPVARGLLIATPVAVLLAGLLASADPVFASFLNINLDFGQMSTDVFFVLVGSLVMAGLLRLAAAEPLERVDGPMWRLGAIEGLVVLAVLDATFAAFAIAQAIAATGAAGDTLRAAGVTYADYARSGFFQLLWVAGITLVVLVLFSRITGVTQRSSKLAFLVLAEIAIALTLLIVAVASMRLSLYESAYGFTMLRLYSHLFAGWIAVVFLLLAADLSGVFRRRRWFVGATTLTALALLMALNIASPEALVARLNVDHAASTGKIDSQYLADLSSDAAPTLLASRSQLQPALWLQIRAAVCGGPRAYTPSPAAFNWADAEAAASRRDAC